MIASLVLMVHMFATSEPSAIVRDLQQIHDRGFDLRAGLGSLQFKPAQPKKTRYQSSATRAIGASPTSYTPRRPRIVHRET
jgi:hypothetical protein